MFPGCPSRWTRGSCRSGLRSRLSCGQRASSRLQRRSCKALPTRGGEVKSSSSSSGTVGPLVDDCRVRRCFPRSIFAPRRPVFRRLRERERERERGETCCLLLTLVLATRLDLNHRPCSGRPGLCWCVLTLFAACLLLGCSFHSALQPIATHLTSSGRQKTAAQQWCVDCCCGMLLPD